MGYSAPARPRAEIVVDLGAIRHNVRILRELVAPALLMTVVKADGYGHGMVPVARAAREAGADWLGVATLDEALRLREAGDTGPLLCWLALPDEDHGPALAAGVDVTAYSRAALDAIVAARGERVPRVHLKVDTGLSRGGAARADWGDFLRHAAALEERGDLRVVGLWSHYASSDDPDDPATERQEAAFEDAVRLAREVGLDPELRHLANSAGAVLRPGSRHELVRCGIATYGLDPAPGHTPDLGLVPAMTVTARLAMVKDLAAGEGVSYGHTWVADRATTVGLVPAGYGDGVPRHAGNAADTWAAGRRRPIRGRVCMDQFVVDLDGDRPIVGDEVVLFGRGDDGAPTAQDWAEACGTINYEIVTRIGGRFARRWVDSDAGGGTR